MKRLIAIAIIVTMGLSVFATGCAKKDDKKPVAEARERDTQQSADNEKDIPDKEAKPMAKVAVNISGTIEEISEDGNKIKVDGQWVTITEDTRFEDDPDNGVEPVSKDLQVGNVIAGWSANPDAEEVVADAIYSNHAGWDN